MDFWAERASDEEEDIDKAIANEVSQLNQRSKAADRRFQALPSGASNIVFIRTKLPNPTELMDAITTDLYNKKMPTSRYIMRMYPVVGTCRVKSYAEEIEEILKPFFGADPHGHSFYLKIKIRNNDPSMRDDIFKTFCYVIKGLNMDNKPNYNTFEYIVIVDVIKTVMCISVLKNYKLYKEYNLQTMGDPFLPDFEQENEAESRKQLEEDEEENGKAQEGEAAVAEEGEEGAEPANGEEQEAESAEAPQGETEQVADEEEAANQEEQGTAE